MKLFDFLEYLHTNAATAQLAEGLAEILALRRVRLVTVEVRSREPLRAVS